MTKQVKYFRCSKELEERVAAYAKNNHISQSEVINRAIEYFFHHEGRDYPELAKMFDAIFKGNFMPLVEEQKRIRLALNSVAKESQMNIELWNNHCLKNGDGVAVTTNVNKAFEIDQVNAKVQGDILKLQQNKHS